MSSDQSTEMQEPSVDPNRLSYEIFSILESKFLFGYGADDPKKRWLPTNIEPPPTRNEATTREAVSFPPTADQGINNNNNSGSDNNNNNGAIKNQRGKICILSIDGGGGEGMRGIVPGKALAYLERALKVKSGDPEARIADYFDVAAGTGVGGIFTSMLFATTDHRRPIFHAEDTWRFLAQKGSRFYSTSAAGGGGRLRRLFNAGGGRSRSSTSWLEKAMRDAFTVTEKGRDKRSLTLKDTLKPVLIPCYDLSSSAPFLFSRADALETDSFDFRLWEVCRATSAAPGVFEPVNMRSANGRTLVVAVDGGLAMSNPAAAAITHVLHNKQEFPHVRGVEDILVLSLGTGQLLQGASCDYEQVKGWRAKDWARPVAGISGDAAAELVDQAVAMAFGQRRDRNYARIQANGWSSGWSEASVGNVNKLVGVAEEMLKQKNVESVLFGGKMVGEQSNLEKLDWFAGELVQEHQRRSCRIAPTVAFKQANPRPT